MKQAQFISHLLVKNLQPYHLRRFKVSKCFVLLKINIVNTCLHQHTLFLSSKPKLVESKFHIFNRESHGVNWQVFTKIYYKKLKTLILKGL